MILDEAHRIFACIDQAKASVKTATTGYHGRCALPFLTASPSHIFQLCWHSAERKNRRLRSGCPRFPYRSRSRVGFTLSKVGALLTLDAACACTETRAPAARKLGLIEQKMTDLAAMRQIALRLVAKARRATNRSWCICASAIAFARAPVVVRSNRGIYMWTVRFIEEKFRRPSSRHSICEPLFPETSETLSERSQLQRAHLRQQGRALYLHPEVLF